MNDALGLSALFVAAFVLSFVDVQVGYGATVIAVLAMTISAIREATR